MILNHLKITEEQWCIYHQNLVAFRNDRLAHFNHGIAYGEAPNFRWMLNSAYLYRESLIQLLHEQQAAGIKIEVGETTGPRMLALFEAQISEICK